MMISEALDRLTSVLLSTDVTILYSGDLRINWHYKINAMTDHAKHAKTAREAARASQRPPHVESRGMEDFRRLLI